MNGGRTRAADWCLFECLGVGGGGCVPVRLHGVCTCGWWTCVDVWVVDVCGRVGGGRVWTCE
jgi:hypothetical protein